MTASNRADTNGFERIETLVTPEQKALLEQAASKRGISLADFVSDSLERMAVETIDGDCVITLGPHDSAIVADALLNPPAPTPALREAVHRYGGATGLVRSGEESVP